MKDPDARTASHSPTASVFRGAWAFALISLAGFSVWAFAGRWFYRTVGEIGLYVAIAVVFLGLSGALLHPLVPGPGAYRRFQTAFLPAFLAYAVGWSGAWFLWPNKTGEWVGSALGCLLFAVIACAILGRPRAAVVSFLVLFVTHSAGYFLGDVSMNWLSGSSGASLFPALSKSQMGTLAKLSWGLFYGLGFGAGIGFTFDRGASSSRRDGSD